MGKLQDLSADRFLQPPWKIYPGLHISDGSDRNRDLPCDCNHYEIYEIRT